MEGRLGFGPSGSNTHTGCCDEAVRGHCRLALQPRVGGTLMSPCPCRERLQGLLAEQLSDTQRQVVEAHVEVCVCCQQLLAILAGTFPRGERLSRPAAPSGDEPSPAFLARLQRALPRPP